MKKSTQNWLNYNNILYDVFVKEGIGQVLLIRKKDEEKVLKYLDDRRLMTAWTYEDNNVLIELVK